MTKKTRGSITIGFLSILLASCSIKNEVIFEPAEIHTLINANVAAWHFYEASSLMGIMQNNELFLGLGFIEDCKYGFYQKQDSNIWRYIYYANFQNDSLFSVINPFPRFIHVCNTSFKNLNQAFATCPINHPNTLFTIDLKNKIRKEYMVHWKDTNLYLQVFTDFYSPVSIKDKLYVPLGNWDNLNDLEYKFSKPSLVEIEFAGDSVVKSTIFGIQAEIYKKDYYKQFEGSFLTTNGQYLYQSFEHDHNIYVYNGHHLIKTVCLPSRHIDKFIPIDTSKNLSDPSYILNYFDSNYIYWKLYYDPYRQLFYRTLVFPAKNTRTYDFSVMVFDKDLRFLSEQIFDGYKYKHGQFVIAKEGVYIGKKIDIQSPHAYMQLFKPTKLGFWGKLKRAFKGSMIDY